jgi:hypothetical protein
MVSQRSLSVNKHIDYVGVDWLVVLVNEQLGTERIADVEQGPAGCFHSSVRKHAKV